MRFEFVAGALCLDFANTIHNSRADDKEDDLTAISDLLQWAKEASVLTTAEHDRLAGQYRRNPREAAAALKVAVRLRDLLLSMFGGVANGHAPSSRSLSELNSTLAGVPGLLRVQNSGPIKVQWKSAAHGFQQILFAVLVDAAELLASNRLALVRECASSDCTWLFIDESRNHSRRWCDMSACGNRMKARRHYRRTRAAK